MTTAVALLGLLLLLVLLVDVHMTVFVPRGGAGIISRRMYRALWRIWRWIGDRIAAGDRRRWWLAQLGPMLVPITVMTWGVLLIGGFALAYAPWVNGFRISPAESGPMPDWALQLYYSGYAAVTLGVGDVVPNGTIPRLLVVVEAGLGFALFTAAISYLLSVYNARNQSTALALAISHMFGRPDGQDPLDLLGDVIASGSESHLNDWMEQLSGELASLVEMSGQYPLVRYFHEPDDYRAMPLGMRDLLELTTTCRTLLDPETHSTLASGPSVRAAHRLGSHFVISSGEWPSPDPDEVAATRRHRYEVARQRLRDHGATLREDRAAWDAFREMSSGWDLLDDGLRAELGYHTEQS